MNGLEQIIQIISIVVFICTAIGVFIKIGEYKSIINTKINILEKDIEDLKEQNIKVEEDIAKLKNDTHEVISRLETLLIEVKTKIEVLMSMSGFGDNAKFKK